MNKLLAWCKEEKRYLLMIKMLIIGLLPVVCCLVYCAMQGKTIGEVYLPASEWNDELFYFKQVEGIVRYGYPQGFFGFDESHALKLTFAAWSPVLVFPWILWGLLFGWNLLSPVVCNIVFLSLAMVLFVWLVRPTFKQFGILCLLFCLYTPFVRYMLSGMPEVLCFGLLIVFYGFAVNENRSHKGWKLAILFILSGLLTLMRPYFLMYMALPVFMALRKKKWKGAVVSLCFVTAILAGYAMIKHYFGAEYFAPLFFTDWVDAFFERGIGGGLMYTYYKFRSMGSSFLGHAKEGITNGLASGAIFCSYLFMMAVFLWQSLAELLKMLGITEYFNGLVSASAKKVLQTNGASSEEENPKTEAIEEKQEAEDNQTAETETAKWKVALSDEFVLYFHTALCFIGMLIALLLMYKLTEGSKHLLTFMAGGIFLISLMDTKYFKKAAFVGLVFAYLFSYKATDPYDYQVPFADEAIVAQIDNWRQVFAEYLVVNEDAAPSYDNVVIWVLSDETEERWEVTKWQLFYAVPEGFGISCCDQSYIREAFDDLKSKYLAITVNGRIDGMCRDAGYRELYRDQDLVLYQRY